MKNATTLLILLQCINFKINTGQASTSSLKYFYKTIEPKDTFYLFEKSCVNKYGLIMDSMKIFDEFNISTSTKQELLEKFKIGVKSSLWENDDFSRDVLVSAKEERGWVYHFNLSLEHNQSNVEIGSKEYDRLEKKWQKRPLWQHTLVHLSKPIFTNDSNYALITKIIECGRNCATDMLELYQRKDGKWILLFSKGIGVK